MHSTLALVPMILLSAEALTRIKGGEKFKIEDHPFNVMIETPRTMCSGSILTKFYVLTAGHCIRVEYRPHQHILKAGTWGFVRPEPTVQVVRGRRLIVNRNFKVSNSGEYQCNVGLIMVQPAFTFNDYVNKVGVGLEYPPYTKYNDKDCWAMGGGIDQFGYAGFLNMMRAVGVRKGRCITGCCQIEAEGSVYHTVHGGDSGGPLVCGGVVVGVISGFRNYIQRFEAIKDHKSFLSKWMKHVDFYEFNDKQEWQDIDDTEDTEETKPDEYEGGDEHE